MIRSAALSAVLALSILTPLAVHAADDAVPAPIDAAAARKLLAGKWILQQRAGARWSSQLTTYREDGTVSSVMLRDMGDGKEKVTLEGNWRIEGDRLLFEMTQSDNAEIMRQAGHTSDRILAISDKEYRYLNQRGADRVEKRTDATEPQEPPATLGYTGGPFVLYQPNNVLEARVPDVAALVEYLKALGPVCAQHLAGSDAQGKVDVVVAIRPGKRSKVWLDAEVLSKESQESLVKQLEAVAPPEIKDGPVAVALTGRVGSAPAVEPDPAKSGPPIPPAWQGVGKEKQVLVPDGILDEIWPDKP